MADKDTLLALLVQETGATIEVVTAIFDKAVEYAREEQAESSVYNRKAWNRIKTGLKILIEVNDGPQQGRYTSKILNRQDKVVTIRVPEVSGSFEVLKPNTHVVVRLRDEDLAIGFNAVTAGSKDSDPPIENLIITGNLVTKSLRSVPRAVARLLCEFKIETGQAKAGGEGGEEGVGVGKGMIKDISCGGLQLVTDEVGLEPGQKLFVSFELPEISEFKDLPVTVVYKADQEKPTYGAKFTEISESDQEFIRKYVSEKLLTAQE